VTPWLTFVRPGDWLVAVVAAVAVALSFPLLWQGGQADRAVIRVDGRVFAEYPLDAPRRIEVPGPLGNTLVEIQPGRARVHSDPGPRQYCVRQGWLVAAARWRSAPVTSILMLMGRQAARLTQLLTTAGSTTSDSFAVLRIATRAGFLRRRRPEAEVSPLRLSGSDATAAGSRACATV
jgi:hypothetical protein